MSIKPEILDAMVASGCTAEQIAAVVKASMPRDTNAERQARFRARQKALLVTDSNVTTVTNNVSNVTSTPVLDKEIPPTPPKEINPTPAKQTPARGTRLAADWVLPVSWGQWAISQGHSEATIRREAEKFADFWHSKAGKDAVKLDWQATWRNWMRNAPAVGRDALARDGPPRKKNIVDVIDELQEKANGRNSDHTFAAFGNVIDITGSSSDGRGIAPALRGPSASAGDRW